MSALRSFAETRPLLFVIALAIAQPLLALPFVAVFRVAGQDLLALRLVIPMAESALVFAVIWLLGWQKRAGLTKDVRNLQVLWYPTLVAFAPVLFYGTIEIAWGWIIFYGAALVFTGISEEGFARGIAIPALMRYGKWAAVLIAAAIFSAGHFTNLFFEDFGVLEWADKLLATFGFAILYGAVFLRTGNLWPLIVLHAVHDYSYLISGTAGPYLAEAFDPRLHMGLSLLNAAYGAFILAGVDIPEGAATRPGPKDAARNL